MTEPTVTLMPRAIAKVLHMASFAALGAVSLAVLVYCAFMPWGLAVVSWWTATVAWWWYIGDLLHPRRTRFGNWLDHWLDAVGRRVQQRWSQKS